TSLDLLLLLWKVRIHHEGGDGGAFKLLGWMLGES
ncbi:hypothetical protein Tco_0547330, partial [Tanacetum coccineum]